MMISESDEQCGHLTFLWFIRTTKSLSQQLDYYVHNLFLLSMDVKGIINSLLLGDLTQDNLNSARQEFT
jgi:hypothetical protein